VTFPSLPIAFNFFRELLRRRALFLIFFFAFVLTSIALLLNTLSLEEGDKMLRDLGLGAISFFSVIATIFLAHNLVSSEISERTIQFLLSKPVSRTQVLAGKFLGLAGVLAVVLLGMSTFWLGLIFYKIGALPNLAVWSLIFLFCELLVLASATIFFSTFLAPLLSLITSVIFYLAGHSVQTVYLFGQKNPAPTVQKITAALHYLVPDLEQLNLKNFVGYEIALEASQIWWSFAWTIFWSALFLTAAVLIFRKKEL
jgi:ABC-type transport system involved in multi-copper enzyme maturation permease subunit